MGRVTAPTGAPPSSWLRLSAGLALATVLATRWLAFGATVYFSLFHWMRVEYKEFSSLWQYGLFFLDPRTPSALLWSAQLAAFWVLVLLPLARWLSLRIPPTGALRNLAIAALAIGLGSRGAVGALLFHAAAGAPLDLAVSGMPPASSWLTRPETARWVVALCDSWWLLPALILACGMVHGRPSGRTRGRLRWMPALLLTALAFLESMDAPYLLTSGGPHGATMNLQLLAYQSGFGRQEFGYASVFVVVLCLLALPAGLALAFCLKRTPDLLRGQESTPSPSEAGNSIPREAQQRSFIVQSWPWMTLLGLVLIPIGLAYARNPAVGPPALGMSWVVSLTSCGIATAWTVFLAFGLVRLLTESDSRFGRLALLLAPALFPASVWILPLLRPLGIQVGLLDEITGPLCLVLGAPYLYVAAAAVALLRANGGTRQQAALGAAALVGWATWTELSLPLMLSQASHNGTLAQSAVVWSLSQQVYGSPLAVPGWPAIWLVGICLGGGLACAVLPRTADRNLKERAS